jgi:ATP/maltotriose-dependent transcriptional regulator MalT
MATTHSASARSGHKHRSAVELATASRRPAAPGSDWAFPANAAWLACAAIAHNLLRAAGSLAIAPHRPPSHSATAPSQETRTSRRTSERRTPRVPEDHAGSAQDELMLSVWSLPELVEAAARCGRTEVAADALERLCERTQAAGTEVALGIEAFSRALLSDGEPAERLYREAIQRLGGSRMRPALARAHLVYGEWLRRDNRRGDAREQLRTAYDGFTAMGMEAFTERARRELVATGETVRKRTVQTRYELTAQEMQIARLAGDGLTNPEIAAQLFVSARTVEWHLRKVFSKLGISSRRELGQALADLTRPAAASL